jgi:hypothetical protein
MQQQRFGRSRARLERVHGRGERAARTLEAITLVVGGTVTLIGGLRTLLDVIVPPPTKESDKD